MHGECLWADGRRADARAFADMCRAVAVLCIEQRVPRLLIDATDCEPEGAQAVRDAFTVMVLAGMPSAFRVALVTKALTATDGLPGVERDLRRLRVDVKVFGGVEAAESWLACPRKVEAPVAAQA